MKKRYLVLLGVFLFLGCNSSKIYTERLSGLDKSYICDNDVKQQYIDCLEYDSVNASKDSIIYYRSLKYFVSANKSIVDYLLQFDGDNSYTNWAVTETPCSSIFKSEKLFYKSRAGLILIDNYLLGNNFVKVNGYIDTITYDELRDFYKENKNLPIDELRQAYRQFLVNRNM